MKILIKIKTKYKNSQKNFMGAIFQEAGYWGAIFIGGKFSGAMSRQQFSRGIFPRRVLS